jgi:hypothetical protein
MATYFQLHRRGGGKVLVNMDLVLRAEPAGDGTKLYFVPGPVEDSMSVSESFEVISSMLDARRP